MHCRTQIREAMVTELEALPEGYTVFNHRYAAIPRDAVLPAVSVYTTEERTQRSTTGGVMERSVTVVVDAYDESTTSSVHDSLDNMAVVIEKAFNTAMNGITVQDWMLENTDLALDEEGNAQIGALSLAFTVVYRASEDDPETLLD